LQFSTILQTPEGSKEKSETQPEEIPKCQVRDKGQFAKLLSYHPMTCPPIYEGKGSRWLPSFDIIVNIKQHNDCPSFLAFLIDNYDERMVSIIE
jgi:hypothetical protein